MSEGYWISALAGAALAAVYSMAAYLLGRLAMRSSQRTFLMIVMGGTVARLFVAMLILTLIILFAPINQMAFMAGFFAIFVVGLAIEIVTLHNSQKAASNDSDKSATDEVLQTTE